MQVALKKFRDCSNSNFMSQGGDSLSLYFEFSRRLTIYDFDIMSPVIKTAEKFLNVHINAETYVQNSKVIPKIIIEFC